MRSTSSLVLVAFISLGIVACSSSTESVFQAPNDAGTDTGPDPNFNNGDGGPDGSSSVCAPASVAGFTPTPVGTKPLAEGVCTGAQLDGYFAACLTAPYSQTSCDAFKAANGDCSACVDTKDGDAQLGAIVWHDNRTWFTLNVAGCIATADKTKAACGAAYDGVLQCKRAACQQCFETSLVSFEAFNLCEKDAGTSVCESYLKKQTADCTTMGDGGPSDQCIPPGGSTLQAAFNVVAPRFCGKPTSDGGK